MPRTLPAIELPVQVKAPLRCLVDGFIRPMVGHQQCQQSRFFQPLCGCIQQFMQLKGAAVAREIDALLRTLQVLAVKRRIAADQIKTRREMHGAEITFKDLHPICIWTVLQILFGFPGGGRVYLNGRAASIPGLRQHRGKQAGSGANIQEMRGVQRQTGKPGAEYAGIRAHFHRGMLLPDGKLLEAEI